VLDRVVDSSVNQIESGVKLSINRCVTVGAQPMIGVSEVESQEFFGLKPRVLSIDSNQLFLAKRNAK